MANSANLNPDEISQGGMLSKSSNQNMFIALKVIEYLFLAAGVCAIGIIITLPTLEIAKIYVPVLLAGWIFLFLTNRQLFENYHQVSNQSNLTEKAELYSFLLSNNHSLGNNLLTPARAQALKYCQELIEDYKKTRNTSRNIYYASQIATIIFSGVTPILVLVDKLEAGVPWLKWLPVICPAIASIVASIVTSFPFQETWNAANTTVELLEAEQENFILGVSSAYRSYDLAEDSQRQQKAQQAIENFITQVNNIHLKQLQEISGKKSADNDTQSDQSNAGNEKTASVN
jgi:hypothetical protein